MAIRNEIWNSPCCVVWNVQFLPRLPDQATISQIGRYDVRVIAKSTLVKFWSQPEYADAKGALQSWHDEAIKAS